MIFRVLFAVLFVASSAFFVACKPPEDQGRKDSVYTQQGMTIANNANQQLKTRDLDLLENFSWNRTISRINQMDRTDLQFCVTQLKAYIAGLSQALDGINSEHVEMKNGMTKGEFRSGLIGLRARGEIILERIQEKLGRRPQRR